MRNLLYEPLPETVCADGREYAVLTDFREWIRFAEMMGSKELTPTEKLMLAVQWCIPEARRMTGELFRALVGFYEAKELEPDRPEDEDAEEAPVRPPVFDWSIDSRYVIGDFLRYYGMDLLHIEHLHWWQFRALLSALPDDSGVMKRIIYRGADLSQIRNESERRRIARIQRQLALPFDYNDEMIGAMMWDAM